jgi:cell division septum initiation protein DivIVA
MKRPYRYIVTPEMLEDRDHYMDPDDCDAYMDALEAENTALKKQMEIGVPNEKLEKRIAALEAKIKSAAEDIESSDDWHTCGTDMAEGLCAACNLAAALKGET